MSAVTSPASAMLAAMLIAALLAASAAVMLVETRSARASASDLVRLAHAEAQASKLLALAEVRLDAGDPLPGQGIIVESEGGRVTRQDAAGLIDINSADTARLAALFSAFGANADEAAALADAIADWRDADDLRHLHGAESDDYLRAGLPPPGNRPFFTETEVASVLGMRADLLRCVLPFLTVYGRDDLDANAAPPELRERLSLAAPGTTGNLPLGNVVIVRAEAPVSAHAFFQRTLWLRLTGDPHQPVMIHRASEGFASQSPGAASCRNSA